MRPAIRQILLGSQRYPLDKIPNPLAIFTLKKLSKEQVLCVKIRRASDNNTTDIGFSGDLLDVSSINTFAGGSNVFVERWYSPTFYIEQTTLTRQPQLIYSESPYIAFDGLKSLSIARTSGFMNPNEFSLVFRMTETIRQQSTLFSFTNSNNSRILAHAPWADGNNYFDLGNPFVGGLNGRISNSSIVAVGQSKIIEFTNSLASNLQAIITNNIVSVAAAGYNSTSTAIKFGIGYESFVPDSGFASNLSSILLFGSQLSDQNRTIVNKLI
jgi:hypothetical protein